MKYKGRKLEGPRKKVVPIIRDTPEDTIYFVVQGVVDLQPFFEVCPAPTAPISIKPAGIKVHNVEDKGYKAALDVWWARRTALIALKSLEATEGLEWEMVDMSDPTTFEKWNEELQNAGLVDAELNRLISSIMEVNGLNEALVEEARKSFLTIQADQANGQSSRQEEAPNGSSGKAASASASGPQDSKA